MSDQVIVDPGDLRKYRTEIPNIIDDLGLDPYQRTLYTHYKRVCGANGGTCEEGIRKTAERTGMSTAKVSLVRRELATRGLIVEHQQPKQEEHIKPQVFITIIDIWELNFFYYSYKEGRPNIAGWTVEQLREWLNSVYVVNADGGRLPSERDRLPHKREQGRERLPGKQKKEPSYKKEHEGTNNGGPPPASHDPSPLLPDSDSARLLFGRVQADAEAKRRRGPKQFPSLECKHKFDEAATRLGDIEARLAIIRALEKGITSIAAVTDFIAKWQKNGGKPNAIHKRNSTQRDPGETFLDPYTGNLVKRDPKTGELVPMP